MIEIHVNGMANAQCVYVCTHDDVRWESLCIITLNRQLMAHSDKHSDKDMSYQPSHTLF